MKNEAQAKLRLMLKTIVGICSCVYKTRMEEGYIIIRVNGNEVLNIDDFKKEVEKSRGKIKLEGMYKDFEGIFPYPLNLNTQ